MSVRAGSVACFAIACLTLATLATAASAGSPATDLAALESPGREGALTPGSARPVPAHAFARTTASRISLVPGIASAFRGAIVLYQVTLSSQDAPVCNYEPTCSRFAQQALRLRGPLIGTLMASDRLQRCLGAARDHYPLDPVTLRALDPVPVAASHR